MSRQITTCLLLVLLWFALCYVVARECLKAMEYVNPLSWASVTIVYAFTLYVTLTIILLLVAIALLLYSAEKRDYCCTGYP